MQFVNIAAVFRYENVFTERTKNSFKIKINTIVKPLCPSFSSEFKIENDFKFWLHTTFRLVCAQPWWKFATRSFDKTSVVVAARKRTESPRTSMCRGIRAGEKRLIPCLIKRLRFFLRPKRANRVSGSHGFFRNLSPRPSAIKSSVQ